MAIALVLGGTSMFVTAAAEAQKKGKTARAPQRQFNLSKAERAAFLNRPALGVTGLDQEISAWDAYLGWAGVPPHPVLEKARGWISAHLPAHRPTGLAWGDARLGNMVFLEQRCRAVLDWETASLGGAESDLGWWIYYDWWVAEGTGVPRLDGIGGREETIRAWEDAIGRKAEAMPALEAFLEAISLSKYSRAAANCFIL